MKKHLWVFPLFVLFTLLSTKMLAQTAFSWDKVTNEDEVWVDSIFNSLTPKERLGQLFMVRAHSDKGPEHIRSVENLIKEYKVGGLCFFQGTPVKQAELTNRYNALSPLPLLISMDAEWGLGMRLKKTTISYPRQLTLGAIKDNDLVYDFGAQVAKELNRLGVHINFAPVVDINNNPDNPVINNRSFGEDRYNVTVKSYQYMKGMQDNGVMACSKHFPGHGDTDVDSHYDLPIINHDMQRLDSIEMFPFEVLSRQNIGSMMVAHLSVPALDDRSNRPTTLSRHTVTNILRNDMQFKGLIFTDGLGMKGVTKHYNPGQVEAEAIAAGNDVLLLPQDVEAALKEIESYLALGKIKQQQVDESVKRILMAKRLLGLHQQKEISLNNLNDDLNAPEAISLKQKLYEHAMTLVRNQDNLIPFTNTSNTTYASISMGRSSKTTFQNRLDSYAKVEHYQVGKTISTGEQRSLFSKVRGKDIVFISIHDMSKYASKDFGISESQRDFIDLLSKQTKVVLVIFGSPYSLRYFDQNQWVLTAYEEDKLAQDVAAQALFGATPISGRLPVTASVRSSFNSGVETKGSIRLGYSLPEAVGMSSDTLQEIAHIVKEGLNKKAMPGCVVLAVKDGKIVFEEAYGHHTYNKRIPMDKHDVFDVASITKVAASTLGIMKMQDEGNIDLQDSIGQLLPQFSTSNKANLTLEDIMAHRAGLVSWIPFYKETLSQTRKNRPSSNFYRTKSEGDFTVKVADNLYMRQDLIDSVWTKIIESDLRPNTNYKYSDIGFYIISMLVNKINNTPIDQYMEEEFYAPLGLQGTCYNAHQKIALRQIVPTERDRYWRQQTLQGYVHDMGAAMLGGVSGHAGLFSTAEDLAVLMQMLLWDGNYAGQHFLNANTIQQYTKRHYADTRRGIGFDMPQTDPDKTLNMAPEASIETFGHLGFTGTAVWADPENDLIFVFLSNRTYPRMNNKAINRLNIRPRIQSVFYRSIK